MIWRPASVQEQQTSSCAESPGGLLPAGNLARPNTTHTLDSTRKRVQPLSLRHSRHPIDHSTQGFCSCTSAGTVRNIPCKCGALLYCYGNTQGSEGQRGDPAWIGVIGNFCKEQKESKSKPAVVLSSKHPGQERTEKICIPLRASKGGRGGRS